MSKTAKHTPGPWHVPEHSPQITRADTLMCQNRTPKKRVKLELELTLHEARALETALGGFEISTKISYKLRDRVRTLIEAAEKEV